MAGQRPESIEDARKLSQGSWTHDTAVRKSEEDQRLLTAQTRFVDDPSFIAGLWGFRGVS
jgi:hypothetical protein